MKHQTHVLSLLLATAVLTPRMVFAQPAGAPVSASADAAARAEALFQEAMRFIAQKQWPDAERKFLAAWALNPSYDVAANLGQTQYRLGKNREAAQHLAYAVKSWPLVGKKEPRELAERRLADLRAQLGSLTIAVDVPGATVLVDGATVGRAPVEMEVFVDPGSHTVEAKLDGYEDARVSVDVAKGAKAAPTLKMVRVAEVRGGPVAPPVMPVVEKRPMWPVVASGAAAVVGIAVGAGLTVAANGKSADANALRSRLGGGNACAGSPAAGVASDCKKLRDNGSTQSTLASAAVGAFVTGGVLALATGGLGLWVISARPRSGPMTGLRVAPYAEPHEAGAVLVGQW